MNSNWEVFVGVQYSLGLPYLRPYDSTNTGPPERSLFILLLTLVLWLIAHVVIWGGSGHFILYGYCIGGTTPVKGESTRKWRTRTRCSLFGPKCGLRWRREREFNHLKLKINVRHFLYYYKYIQN